MPDAEPTFAPLLTGRTGLDGPLAERVLDSLADAIVVIDTDAIVIGWSPAAERLFGYSSDEALGKTLNELVIPTDRDNEFAMFQGLVEAGRTVRLQTQRRAASGDPVDVDLFVTAVADGSGTGIA